MSAVGIGSNPYPGHYCCAHARVGDAESDPNYYNNEDFGYIYQGADPKVPNLCGRPCG